MIHSTDREKCKNVKLTPKYDKEIDNWFENYGVERIDWVQHLIHQINLQKNVHSLSKYYESKKKSKNKSKKKSIKKRKPRKKSNKNKNSNHNKK